MKLHVVPLLLHMIELREETDALRRAIRGAHEDTIDDALYQIKRNEKDIEEIRAKVAGIIAEFQLDEWHVNQFISEYGPEMGLPLAKLVFRMRK